MKSFEIVVFFVFLSLSKIIFSADIAEVFTKEAIDDIQEQTALETRYYSLSDISRWEAEMSKGLPGNKEDAIDIVSRRIEQMGGQVNFEKSVASAYRPLTRAITLGVKEYPVVVFDEKYAIYGTDSVAKAMEILTRWKREN